LLDTAPTWSLARPDGPNRQDENGQENDDQGDREQRVLGAPSSNSPYLLIHRSNPKHPEQIAITIEPSRTIKTHFVGSQEAIGQTG
jgi:hypothetical protein